MTDKPKTRRGLNLSQEDRERGGRTSAAKQNRDSRGQFAGSKSGQHGAHAGTPAPKSAGKHAQSNNRARADQLQHEPQKQEQDQEQDQEMEMEMEAEEVNVEGQREDHGRSR